MFSDDYRELAAAQNDGAAKAGEQLSQIQTLYSDLVKRSQARAQLLSESLQLHQFNAEVCYAPPS